MKIPQSNDRRVVRTRATLREALVSLILERGWDEISVRDVCDRANVGRSTFYTHFADKEDLLLSGFDDLRRVLRLVVKAGVGSGKGVAFSRALLEHAHENRRLFRALVGKRSSQAVQKQFLQVVIDLTEEELARSLGAVTRFDATVHYVAGAFFQLVIWWLESRKALQPAEIDAFFQQLTKPVLAAARTNG
jgi:AcrR family transcriptional regulator